MIGVVDLVKGDSRTTMIHIDLNLSRVMVYAQSVEKSKLCRIARNLKRDGSSEKNQYRFKKRAPAQDEPSAPKVKLEKGSRSLNSKPTCASCRKKHYGKCLVGNGNYFCCGKEGQKVRDCPSIASRVREAKQVPPCFPSKDVPRKNHFHALRDRGSKTDENEDVDKFLYFSL